MYIIKDLDPKKIAGPWLLHRDDEPVWGKLEDALMPDNTGLRWHTFSGAREAQAYVLAHPEICHPSTIICLVVVSDDGIAFEPVNDRFWKYQLVPAA